MLTVDEITEILRDMWVAHQTERLRFDRIHGYVEGKFGVPEVPDGAGEEVKELAKLSVMNVLAMVRDSFAQNLSVTGYREVTSHENDAAWSTWQRNRMDARQAEVHRAALTYGASYVVVMPGDRGPVFYPRSPRQIFVTYADPQIDSWPQYALETWIDSSEGKPRRKARLFDDTYVYPLDLGEVVGVLTDQHSTLSARGLRAEFHGDPEPHGATHEGAPVCPVVRFINARDSDDLVVGEIENLITTQRSINSVNFDRLIVSRFGAFPQKVITGWSAEPDEVLRASAGRVWAFDDPDVKATTLAPGSTDSYNELLSALLEHVAMVAQISPAQVSGKMVNVSAEALAAAEANQQRKLAAKRESFGEGWEQVLQLAAAMDGDTATAEDSGAEVVWRDTEARSFGTVVDGITKLVSAGVPIEALLTMIPGMTQQTVTSIGDTLRSQRSSKLLDAIRAGSAKASTDPKVAELASRQVDDDDIPA